MYTVYRSQDRLQNYLQIRRDPIAFFTRVRRECGDFVQLQVLTFRFYLINDPALIHEALVEQSEQLIIKGGVSAGLSRLIGHGILTNRGVQWRASRTSLQPLFSQRRMTDCLPIMIDRVQESLDRWHTQFSGRPFPMNRELLALSFRITCSTLFAYTPAFDEAVEFADAIWVLQLDGMKRHVAGMDYVPWIPLATNRRVERARATLRRLAQRICEHGDAPPLDEVRSILFAGTESPVNTLCFSLQLLEEHPEWRARLTAEVAGDDVITRLQDADANQLLSQVLSESMRLYPAGWAFERYAAQDATLGGALIEAGSRLLFSPFLMHRNPRFWSEPERFNPLRFAAGSSSAIGVPKYGYMPFGAGPRSCIGSRLAQMEMRITLGMILSQCDWKIEPDPHNAPLRPEGSFKIRLSRPLMISMTRRSPRTSSETPRAS